MSAMGLLNQHAGLIVELLLAIGIGSNTQTYKHGDTQQVTAKRKTGTYITEGKLITNEWMYKQETKVGFHTIQARTGSRLKNCHFHKK